MNNLLILLNIIFICFVRAEFQPTYQVLIQLKNSNQHTICNGIIIHEEYILTTANCFYLPLSNTNIRILVTASDLSVVVAAGLQIANSNSTTIQRDVVSIIPHHEFNATTYDNDIAVLKLDRALPLAANSTEVHWLDISSSVNDVDSCFFTIYNSSQESGDEFYSIWENPLNLQYESCNDVNGSQLIHQMDLCLEYPLSTIAYCNSTSINLKYSNERGTAYVCNNKLVGILAEINLPKDIEKCFLMEQTTGFYVDVKKYIDWLSTDVGILQNSSVPSWKIEPVNEKTTSTDLPSTTPSNAGKVSFNIIWILLVIKFMTLF